MAGIIADDPRQLRGYTPPAPSGPASRSPSPAFELQGQGDQYVQEPTRESRLLLENFRRDYDALDDYREERRQARNDLRGKQWERSMEDPDNPGKTVKEKEYIERQGRVPYVMNQVAPTIRNLVGQLMQNESERMAYAVRREDNQAAEQMTVALRAARRINRADVLEPDQFVEHLLGGMHVWKAGAQFIPQLDRNDVLISRVDPNRFAFNRDLEDRRLKGLSRIGEMHEVTLDELSSKLAENQEHEQEIVDVYSSHAADWPTSPLQSGFDHADNVDFYQAVSSHKVRMFEIWHTRYEWVRLALDPTTGAESKIEWSEEEIENEQAFRRMNGIPELEIDEQKEPVWYCTYLTPTGHVLYEKQTPYWHQSHPYVVGFAQWIDGEWWGLVQDVMDPQRLVNRLTSAIDHMISASAKGVLLVDEESLENSELDLDEIAEEWSSFNGVIALKPASGKPVSSVAEQVTSNAIPAGMFNWLAEQKQNIENQSGVMGAQMGKPAKSDTPASLYAQQQTQASLTTYPFFESFFQTLYELDRKLIQLVMQFYDEPRHIAQGRGPAVQYDPERIRELDFDVAVGNANDTATYRQMFEQRLMEFLGAGHVTFDQFLQMSSHPKAQQIQKVVERTNPLIQGQATELDNAPPELVGAMMSAARSGDVDARTLVQQAADRPAQPQQPRQPARQPAQSNEQRFPVAS